MPAGVTITPINDQSGFVRDSVVDVVREMVTAAFLTGMMVLLFLGSWRSTLIVATSIPLCILTSIMVLSWLGQTINVMTLGGLALAVGILVDDATVMIENIAAHLETGQELEAAIVEAANQIVVPTFVSTLCICIVWLPLFSLSGIGGYLFRPLAMAIIFAMIASFILSRTLVPTMAAWLLRGQGHHAPAQAHADGAAPRRPGPFVRFQGGFERRFTRLREGYRDLLGEITAASGRFILGFLAVTLLSLCLIPFLGRDFFPEINSANLDLHMRAQIGTRIEDTGKLAVLVNQAITKALHPHVVDIVDNCGLPASGINEAYSANGVIGTSDCELSITLDREDSPVQRDRRILRRLLKRDFPGTSFNFLPGDITAKILNFGLPAPIDVQVIGRDLQDNFRYAKTLAAKIRRVPGAVDVSVFETMSEPTLDVNVNRSFATRTNLTEANVADNALSTLSGSTQVGVSYWLDPKTGVSYLVNVQTPQNEIDTMNDLETVPIDSGNGDPGGQQVQLLGGLGRIVQSGMPLIVSHYSITPTIDVYASTGSRDLGAVNDAISKILADNKGGIPKSATVSSRGQAVTMASSYTQLVGGLLFAVVLIYLVIVVNFQSWVDPFIIITALPGALAGIAWSLFITGTTLSVPALTGAIMCMGTATANSILVVSFARERLAEHGDAARAAVEAGYARLRPVLMTALAMIIGMLPMSVSNTQNAPLGRAVMGGLMVATVSTLLFVPSVFTFIHGRRHRRAAAAEAH